MKRGYTMLLRVYVEFCRLGNLARETTDYFSLVMSKGRENIHTYTFTMAFLVVRTFNI